jgi:uncharacterized protein involved in exopolysaccharide biosynthesis
MDPYTTDTSLSRPVSGSDRKPNLLQQASGLTRAPMTMIHTPVSDGNESPRGAAHNDTLLPLIWRQRALVLVCTLLGMVGAAIYIHFATPLWTTEARIIISRSSPIMGDGDATTIGDNFLNTQCELIKSSPILALAISNIDADNLQLFATVHNRISFLKNNMVVEVAKRSDIIDVDMETPYPADGKRVVQAVVNAYQDFQHRELLSNDGQMVNILQREKDKRDTELDDKSRALDDLRRSQAAAGMGDENTSITMQRLSTLSNALTNAQLDTLTARSAYEQAAKSAGINISDPNWIAKDEADASAGNQAPSTLDEDSIRARLFDLQQQMATLRRQYLPGHPAIQAIQSRINELTHSIVAAARQRWLTAQSLAGGVVQHSDGG